MLDPFLLLVIVIFLALLFDFTNGWHDTANSIATVIGTRTLTPLTAIIMAAILNLCGAFFSTEVAKTIGGEIVNPDFVTQPVLIAGLLAAILWNVFTVLLGLPTSSSHALIGGLIGSAMAYQGTSILQVSGITKILIGILIAPIIGGLLSFALYKMLRVFFIKISRKNMKRLFKPLQILSSGYMAFSHGAADAQKAMGIITLSLFTAGYQKDINVVWWVTLSAGLAMAFGTLVGGSQVIKTVGMKLSRLETPQGFIAETSAATLLASLSHIGLPVSTSHTITGSILGVGAASRFNSVRWGLASKIVYAWILTLPSTWILGYIFYLVLDKLLIR